MLAAGRALVLAILFVGTLVGGVASAQEGPLDDGLVQIQIDEPSVSDTPVPGSATTSTTSTTVAPLVEVPEVAEVPDIAITVESEDT